VLSLSLCRVRALGQKWLLLFCLIGLGVSASNPVWAGVELARLEVIALADRVQIIWETSSEYDIAAFQLFYKPELDPTATYQPITQLIPAQGQLGSGAIYEASFLQLQPNVSYCFRLQVVTSNDEPGDLFERCGYGPGTSPTPTFTVTPTITPTPTETPFVPPPPFPADGGNSPLATPIPDLIPGDGNESNGSNEGGVTVIMQTPIPLVEQPLDSAPSYIVQTATPTYTPQVFAPTPTALPMATPTPALAMFGLNRWLADTGAAPAALNEILAMMLCLGGIGLAMIGAMTLLGTIFYLRSRM
jgi:hypothetical protein